MSQFAVTNMIHRPAEVVFPMIADVTNWVKFNARLVEAQQTSPGPMCAGATFRAVNKFFGQHLETVCHVTEYEPNKTFAFAGSMSGFAWRWRYTLYPVNSGTKVTLIQQQTGSGLAALMNSLVTRTSRKMFIDGARTLKNLLEAK